MPHAPSDPDGRSRQRLIDLLKRAAPLDAAAMAQSLGLSAMAVRQHLYRLQAEHLVTHDTQPRPMGRPAKLWRLTPEADRFFPDGHAALAADLIASLVEQFGTRGLDKLIASRSRTQVDHYRRHIPRRMALRQKLEALAASRTEEGYMAEVLPLEDGSYLLVENHCPICTAASACTGLCASELEVFREVLGPQVELVRTEHILAGARRCVYRANEKPALLRASRD